MGFFQDLKQDLSQTVNDLSIKDETDELDVEEESTTTASEDLFGSASDTDFEDLESMLEKEVAALGESRREPKISIEDADQTDTSDIDLEALLSDIEMAEKNGIITEADDEIQTVSGFSTDDEQENGAETILDEFSFDDIKPIEEEIPQTEETPGNEFSEEALQPIEEETPVPEEEGLEELVLEELALEAETVTQEAQDEEPSEDELLPLEEEAETEEAPMEELPEEEKALDESPAEESDTTGEAPVAEVLSELPIEEILIPEESPEETQNTDDNSVNMEIDAENKNNSEAEEDMEQLLNEVEQNIQEHTYMDEAPAAANADNSETNAVISTDTAVITAGMNITGDVTSSGNMDLIGSITGNIEILGKLNVTGTITGNSAASEVYAESAQINGEINSKGSVKIGQSSVVIGNIFAKSAVIAGAVKGDIDVHGPVILDTSAIVMGNIKSKSVQINNGAVIEGMCSQCYADISPTSFFNDVKKNRK